MKLPNSTMCFFQHSIIHTILSKFSKFFGLAMQCFRLKRTPLSFNDFENSKVNHLVAKRNASVVWEKDLLHGSGKVKLASGALAEFPVSWSARIEESGGKTSPEELLAAAQASCFAMAMSAGLARNGTPPERLDVNAQCTFEKVGDGWKVTTMEINVEGKVPGISNEKFEEVAASTAKNCPISGAISGNVKITHIAKLA